MPYPNEFSCRIKEPIDGAETKRKNGEREHEGKKYDVIYQKQNGKWVDQAYRYPKETWSKSEAHVPYAAGCVGCAPVGLPGGT